MSMPMKGLFRLTRYVGSMVSRCTVSDFALTAVDQIPGLKLQTWTEFLDKHELPLKDLK